MPFNLSQKQCFRKYQGVIPPWFHCDNWVFQCLLKHGSTPKYVGCTAAFSMEQQKFRCNEICLILIIESSDFGHCEHRNQMPQILSSVLFQCHTSPPMHFLAITFISPRFYHFLTLVLNEYWWILTSFSDDCFGGRSAEKQELQSLYLHAIP